MNNQHVDQKVQITALSESAVAVHFGQEIDPNLHRRVVALTNYLDEHPFQGLVEVVSSFTNVTVFYDPMNVSNEKETPSAYVCSLLKQVVSKISTRKVDHAREMVIPVCYGGELGPDIEFVASYNQLSVDEVIRIHSETEYLVYMVGFAPGFPYLGGLSEEIATPRKQKPRLDIPPGAVGIGGAQTGVYSIATPGGWQLIGQTPIELFLPNEEPPSLFQPGDKVRFQPISLEEYDAYKEGMQWR